MFDYIVMILGYSFFIFSTVILLIVIKQALIAVFKRWVLDRIILHILSYEEETGKSYSERNHKIADATNAVNELKNLN